MPISGVISAEPVWNDGTVVMPLAGSMKLSCHSGAGVHPGIAIGIKGIDAIVLGRHDDNVVNPLAGDANTGQNEGLAINLPVYRVGEELAEAVGVHIGGGQLRLVGIVAGAGEIVVVGEDVNGGEQASFQGLQDRHGAALRGSRSTYARRAEMEQRSSHDGHSFKVSPQAFVNQLSFRLGGSVGSSNRDRAGAPALAPQPSPASA
jgi:hypothetical protein